MATTLFKPPANIYNKRLTPPTSSKPCYICHKPTTTVLITPGTPARDFFYVCPGHLSDRGFAVPAPGEPGSTPSSSLSTSTSTPEDEARKKEKDLKEEIGRIESEYTVRKAARKAHFKAKPKQKQKQKKPAAEKDKNGKRIKDDTDPALDKLDEDEAAKEKELGTDSADEREKKGRIDAVRAKAKDGEGDGEAGTAKTFVLHKDIWNMRVQRMRDAAGAGARKRGEVSSSTRGAGGRGNAILGLPSVPRTLG